VIVVADFVTAAIVEIADIARHPADRDAAAAAPKTFRRQRCE